MSADSSSRNEPNPQNLRQLQIIVGALVTGCVVFLAITQVVDHQGEALDKGQTPIQTYIAIVYAVMSLAARVVAPGVMVSAGRKRIVGAGDEDLDESRVRESLMQLLLTKTIVGAAIIEGATFFMLIAHMIEGMPLTLVLAVALIVVLAFHMPTRSGVTHWIEDQLALIDQERKSVR